MGHALGNNYGKLYSFQSKPVIVDLQFQVQAADSAGLGVTNVKGQGVKSVFMHTSATPGVSNGITNPNPALGFAQINLAYNYVRMYCADWSITSPVTGSALAINASALTANTTYQIITVGAGPTGACTIAPVADSSGSLASTWFRLYDAYGNTFIFWFSVNGVGSPPSGVSGIPVQVSIATNATAATIGAAIVNILNALPAQQTGNATAPAGVFSFTAAGTTTVTATSTLTGQPLPGVPQDGTVATGFTFALTKYGTNANAWKSVGLPIGVAPSIGASFVALNTGYATGGGSTGTVKAVSNSGIVAVEMVGDPNLSINPVPYGGSANVGGYFMVQFLGATNSSTTTLIPTNPPDSCIVKMKLLLEQAYRVGGNNE